MRLRTKCVCTAEFEVESDRIYECQDAYDQFLEDHSFCRQMSKTLMENIKLEEKSESHLEALQRVIRLDKKGEN